MAIKVDDATHHSNLGNVLRDLGLLGRGRAAWQTRGRAGPRQCRRAHHNHGLILQDLGRHAEALAEIDEAIRLEPGNVGFRWDRALNLLCWAISRGASPSTRCAGSCRTIRRRDIATPEWKGEPLEGRTILIWAEQGFGDTLQFVRYAPMLKASGRAR